ncbi:DUF6527 family protein [Mesorhizobium sp. BE184]|uniref:DUF6527 family protein n=1 Tax=Mesorhizobium sp. BE184 TaxID=2817714 RepID=UPI0028662F77|nr:DUF6527 family protein [Mesorhizobium sp. BE184]MDR7034479.1 hypothetical protein [Mesorhizobium sp. BE184]
MSEVKTEPVKATYFAGWIEQRDAKVPGSVSFSETDDEGDIWMSYSCPCGCGRLANLLVGKGVKPELSPSWNWNGSTDKPTLTPSVHHVGHWHGYLTDGVWRSC